MLEENSFGRVGGLEVDVGSQDGGELGVTVSVPEPGYHPRGRR